ncbi:heme-degrading domain-containing protein [Pseudomonas graminis]|uniref:heme-degrading domain-containing protein n=1 Tax=Pseudomonas graminis TaxID=158627 RepID=UPI0023495A55|nr:heme-degrading domain-containing protein [Pseudomonas graminis]MDC6378959.1 heme-degrading domain-containing protein [Pseudomonas graminis]
MVADRKEDLRRIAQQEEALQFDSFDKTAAWKLGVRLKSASETLGVSVTIEVRLSRETVFLYAMPGTSESNADWARRKRNVVEMMSQSSYRVGLSLEEGESLEALMGLPARDYATHGGSFPIKVKGVGFVGVATVSGLPQRQDHALVVRVLAGECGADVSDCLLTP